MLDITWSSSCRNRIAHALNLPADIVALNLSSEGFLRLEVAENGTGIVRRLFQQDAIEQLIATCLQVSEKISQIRLIFGDGDQIDFPIAVFVQTYGIEKNPDVLDINQIEELQQFCLLQQRCRAALDSFPSLAIILDSKGRYVDVNKHQELLVAPWQKMVGRTFADVPLPKKTIDILNKTLQQAFFSQGKPHGVEYDVILNNQIRRCHATFYAYGGLDGEAIAIIYDITDNTD